MGAYRNFMDLVPKKFSLTAQEEILKSTAEDYFNEDYSGSERFEVELPLKNPTGVQTHQRVPLLAISEKKSLLFKFFARNPMIYPGSSEKKRYPLTYVFEEKNKGRSSEHFISIPPDEPYNLKGFADLLEKVEDRARKENKETQRAKDKPREGLYDYNDPGTMRGILIYNHR